jgi:hypothetical protein
MKHVFSLICVLMYAVHPTIASDVKVIANSSVGVSQISPEDLRRVFLVTKTSLADGSHVVPVLLNLSSAYKAFLQEYIDKTPAGLENYYRSLAFTGKGTMPKMLKTEAAVLEYVKRTKGAIGFVSADAQTEGVKLLEVK